MEGRKKAIPQAVNMLTKFARDNNFELRGLLIATYRLPDGLTENDLIQFDSTDTDFSDFNP